MSRTIVCPQCCVPYIRHGLAERSTNFHITDNDICIVCREGLEPADWLPGMTAMREEAGTADSSPVRGSSRVSPSACIMVLVAALLATGCAAATSSLSTSFDTLMRLQLRERAGIFPPDWDVVGDSHAANYSKLATWARAQGFIIVGAPLASKNLLGHVQYGGQVGWVVLINEDLPPNNKLYTLAHELGHVYGPRKLTYQEAETVAEVIAASVCQRVGLDVWPQTASYLASHSELEVQTAVVQRYGRDLDKVITMLSAAAQ